MAWRSRIIGVLIGLFVLACCAPPTLAAGRPAPPSQANPLLGTGGFERRAMGTREAQRPPTDLVALETLDEAPALPIPLEEELLLDESGLPYPADDVPAPTLTSGQWLNDGLWFFEGEVVMLALDNSEITRLAVDLSENSLRRLRVDSGDLGMTATTRMTMGRYLFRDDTNRDHNVEFTFFGLGDWSVSKSIQSITNNQLFSLENIHIGGFNGADRQRFAYRSNFRSYDLNYRIRTRLRTDRMVLEPDGRWVQRATPGVVYSLLGGVRVWNNHELFSYDSLSTVPDLRRGSLDIRASNTLIGVQFGGDVVYQSENWNFGVRGKVGPYVNFAHQSSDLLAVDPVFLNADRFQEASHQQISLLAELSVLGRYYFQPWLSMHVGYEAMFLNSVANAPEQITFALGNTPLVRTGGDQFYQGFSLGFEVTW